MYVQREVPEAALKHVAVREVAIHISPDSAREGDRGRVIIGGSMQLGDLASHAAAREHARLCLRRCAHHVLSVSGLRTWARPAASS